MEKRWGGEGGGQQQSRMLPWQCVYASLMHLVDPIRGWLCLHRHMHACSGVMHAHTHAYVPIWEPMCVSAPRIITWNLKSWILLLQNQKSVGDLRQSALTKVIKTGTTVPTRSTLLWHLWPVCKFHVAFIPFEFIQKKSRECFKGWIRSYKEVFL